jgi:hypothetical protein
MGGSRRPPRKRLPLGPNLLRPTEDPYRSHWVRRVLGSIVGLATISVEWLAPHKVIDLLAIINAPDDIHKLWGVVMWSATHFATWAPIALGVAIICWANWPAMRSRFPSDGLTRWGLILGLLALSWFVPTERFYGDISVPQKSISKDEPPALPTPSISATTGNGPASVITGSPSVVITNTIMRQNAPGPRIRNCIGVYVAPDAHGNTVRDNISQGCEIGVDIEGWPAPGSVDTRLS